MPRRLELHCHSIYSDGTLSPAEIVARAVKSAVELLVLTDHDTVSGAADLFAAGSAAGLDVRLGIEINCAGEGAADRVHVLLDGDPGNHLGRLAQPGIDDLRAGVAERHGDDLGADVVAVEPRLGDQDALSSEAHDATAGSAPRTRPIVS